ncbi:hypothetical protein J4E08_07715 [Sagittula sp. NFXS13]|uniref:DUF5671 domain-containing protein n=1 Tax=Sagittula sp. NFXS13 TaxID=2819095 RepID=UPI0032DEEAB0
MSDVLFTHIRDALNAGQSADTIRQNLKEAGWTASEIDTALAAWMPTENGAVPRPIRPRTARDAFFYALMFVVFGMVAGNVLSLLYGQINLWLPEIGEGVTSGGLSGLRWSMAALIVFTPAFFFLDQSDRRDIHQNDARRHSAVRRWLSALALLIAVCILLGDALFLIFTWLNGQMTLRFLVKSLVVAGLSLVVLAYFDEGRDLPVKALRLPAAPILIALALLSLGLSLWTVGGPKQGQMEARDTLRLRDLNRLETDLLRCDAMRAPLPATFDPLDCASAPDDLTAFAAQITYDRQTDTTYRICIAVEAPDRMRPGVGLDGDRVCRTRTVSD